MAVRYNFKCILVGEEGSGRTSFAKKLHEDEADGMYTALLGVDVYPVELEKGKFLFSVWDMESHTIDVWNSHPLEGFDGIDSRGMFYGYSGCGVIMIDFDQDGKIRDPLRVAKWHHSLRAVCPTMPIVVVVNKRDLREEADVLRKEKGDSIFDLPSTTTITINDEVLRMMFTSTIKDSKEQLLTPLTYLLGQLKRYIPL